MKPDEEVTTKKLINLIKTNKDKIIRVTLEMEAVKDTGEKNKSRQKPEG